MSVEVVYATVTPRRYTTDPTHCFGCKWVGQWLEKDEYGVWYTESRARCALMIPLMASGHIWRRHDGQPCEQKESGAKKR